ncbi:carbohydrate ABC transporter permease [Cohnella sp. GCM10012308]|uniref:carbohydrate ABC transporter permease n=1 Tax=Cohnella sp. GCM10012308 TaxID=3317329 RepID=UPI003622A5A1
MRLASRGSGKWVDYVLVIILLAIALLCLLPIVHIFALSLSSKVASDLGRVSLWPVDPTLSAYKYVLSKPEFFASFYVSVQRVLLGLAINMTLAVLVAYPLSKETSTFRLRSYFAWYFVITMLVNGGLIPTYMTVKEFGLIGSIWALVIPGAVQVYNVVLLLNFFRGLPKEMEESAFIDGAGHWRVLASVYIPLSPAVLATIALFTMVGHWNAWFDGLIYMKSPDGYPLQTYLQSLLTHLQNELQSNLAAGNLAILDQITERTARAAQIFLATLPILLVYPFLQKYFIKGIVMGSVKG